MGSDKSVFTYNVGDENITLKSDLAAEFPVYIYLYSNKRKLLYSNSAIDLLSIVNQEEELSLSSSGISFLLQSSMVPHPNTVYTNLYILGIGDLAIITTNKNDEIEIEFDFKFPFYNSIRNKKLNCTIKEVEKNVLELVANATIERIDPSKKTFLFHSAGKDSNIIALALAEAGWQDRVELVSHKSKGSNDESEISKQVAKKLGFQHSKLHEKNRLNTKSKMKINEYFSKCPFPCMDNVTLAYFFYVEQKPELRNSNLIDGLGNDAYIGYLPPKKQIIKQKYFSGFSFLRQYGISFSSTSRFISLFNTIPEHVGFGGLSFCDTQKLYSEAINVYSYWKNKEKQVCSLDLYDIQAIFRGGMIDLGIFQRKVRNFGDVINSNVIFPYANESVASYLSHLPEEILFDRKTSRNKILFRNILSDRIGLDSDKIGKMAFSYDKQGIIKQNIKWVKSEILKCELWDESVHEVCERLLNKESRNEPRAQELIHKLLLISLWINNNKYTIN